ncbi:MAG: hypothetical protein MJA29_04930 [Candidatus Omnitrophica bacterium]|nr:hypothetical protein [Candidatus Omnitrophota bacterium]
MKRIILIVPVLSIYCFSAVILFLPKQGYAADREENGKLLRDMKKIEDHMSEELRAEMSAFVENMTRSIFIEVPDSSKEVIYIAPGVEIKGDPQLLSDPKHKAELNGLKDKIQQLARQDEDVNFHRVFLYPNKNIDYGFLYRIINHYEDAVSLVYPKEGGIWYKLCGMNSWLSNNPQVFDNLPTFEDVSEALKR